MTCKHCRGDVKRCAFDDTGTFKADNFNCITLGLLRDLAEMKHRDDDSAGSIAVIPIPEPHFETEVRGYIVLNFYKNRCRTNSALILNEDDPPRPLTLEIAQWVISRSADGEPVEEGGGL